MDDSATTEWLVSGGELDALVRSTDWSDSPLGPREQWPEALRTLLGVVLGNVVPMALLWGREWHLFYNDAYRTLAAARPPQALGVPVRTTWRALWDVGEDVYARLMAHGEPVTHHGADVTLCHTVVRDGSGRIGGVLVTFREDTTAREREPRASTSVLRAISDGSSDAIFAKDRNGTFLYANPATLAILGKSLDAVLGKTDAELMDDASVALEIMANDRRVIEGGVAVDLEELVPYPDGTRRLWLSRKAPYRDEGGRVAGLFGISRDITERKQAQEEIRRAKERLQSTLDTITDGYVVLDREWRYVYFSETAARMVGVRQQDMLGNRIWDLFPHARGTKFDTEYHRAVDSGEPVEFEEYYPAPVDKWLECRGFPSAEGLTVYFRDVTAQNRYEQALRESEERLRAAIGSLTIERGKLEAIIRALPVGIGITETDGTTISMNDAALRLHGFTSAEEMLAQLGAYRDSFEILRLDGSALPIEEWPAARAMRGEYVRDLEVILRNNRAGSAPMVSYSVVPVHDDAGKPTLFVYLMLDVTERKQREGELRWSKDRLELLARATTVFMETELDAKELAERLVGELVPAHTESAVAILLSADRLSLEVAAVKHVLADAQAELAHILRAHELPRRHGLSPEDLALGQAHLFARLGRSELEHESSPALSAYLAQYPVGTLLSIPLRTARGVLGALRLARSPDAAPFTAIDQSLFQDIADRAALALEAAARFAEAEQAIRLRDDFLSIASHELRTPLTALQLQLQSMQHLLSKEDETDQSARFVRKLEGSTRQTSRLVSLVEGLLDVSHLSLGNLPLHREELDLADIAREVVERHSSQASAAGCTLRLEAETVRGQWDRLRIEQVLTNLIANAMKYGAGKPVGVTVTASGDVARLTVRDHGIGIQPVDLARIFGRFERAVSDRHYGGLGLGLYISKQIVEAHGGAIKAESEPGEGSTFHVTLPRSDA